MLWRETLFVRLIGLTKIPFLFLLRPRVLRLDEDGSEVLVPLSYVTRNHVGSMYFGALAAGADCSGGLNALRAIVGAKAGIFRGAEAHPKVVPIFKSLHADFFKLADGDAVFRCDDGRAIAAAVAEAERSGERVTLPVTVTITVPARHGDAPVARFSLELSLKRKS